MSGAVPEYDDTVLGNLQDSIADLRGLHEEFGTRRYRVVLLWIRWSGQVRGQGSPFVEERFELRPVPEVYDEAQLAYRFRAGGAEPEGDWQVTQICHGDASGRLITADLLRGERDGIPAAPNLEFCWELQSVLPGGKTFRFRVAGEPSPRPTDWLVNLKHLSLDSPRDGATAGTVRL